MTISDRLLAAGYQVETANSGEKALAASGPAPGKGPCNPDLVILDIMLPGIDGFEVCKTLRNRRFTMPILMLTAKGAVNDRVKGLKLGADDYLGKPFAMQELMARIEAQLRRSRQSAIAPAPAPNGQTPPPQTAIDPSPTEPIQDQGTRTFGIWTFDLAGRTLWPSAQGPAHATKLSTTEFRLLSILSANPGRVMSREELLDAAWGYNNETTSRTVDVHIAWLRNKLNEPDPPHHLITIRRGGYKFIP